MFVFVSHVTTSQIEIKAMITFFKKPKYCIYFATPKYKSKRLQVGLISEMSNLRSEDLHRVAGNPIIIGCDKSCDIRIIMTS